MGTFPLQNTNMILIFLMVYAELNFQTIKSLTLDMKFMMVSHAKNMLPLSIPSCLVISTRQSITCRDKHRQSQLSYLSKKKN